MGPIHPRSPNPPLSATPFQGQDQLANLDVGSPSFRDQTERALRELRRRAQAQLNNAPNLGVAARCALAALGLVVLTGIGIGALALYMMFAPIELPKPLEGAKAASTQILGADGAVIEQWHGPINRTPVSLSKMSQNLQQAAVAAEDARFHQRGAVDLRAVMRAAKANLVNGSYVQGGSTISQQYAKNVYVGNARSISRKIKEARVAYRLERDLGKAKVLEGYLNTVYFGRGAYGVEAASKIYFGKAASGVSVSEAALLISMIKSPDAYSPYYHPARSETRRQWVLERMEKLGMLGPQELREAVGSKPVLTPASAAHPKYGWYMDALRTYLIGKYGSEKVYAGGLKVQTTLDPQAQQAAETTIANALPDVKDPYAALVSIDPATGYVTAIVGGRDYSQEKYNIALQGRRQPGSSFKPFVLAAALEAGIPVSAGYRAPRTICPKGWRPSCVSNFGRAGYGRMNLEQATINSVNTVYAQLVMDVGPKKVVDLARRAGIPGPEWLPRRSGCEVSADESCGTQIQAVPAMALGTEEVTPLELASGYATLAAGGVYREPKLVSKVEDANGKVLEEGPSVGIQAIKPSVAEAVNGILAKVITRGTGTRADFGRPAAGKTGTAQDHSNAWFSGYTPQLATSVWMGYRGSNKPLVNVQGVSRVTGGSIPAEMWRDYMKGVGDRLPPTLDLAEGPVNGSFSRANSIHLAGTAADEDGMVQGIEISIDSGPFGSAGVQCRGCQEPSARWSYESLSALPDGEHQISVRSFDRAGHRSEAVTRKITVDTQRPALEALASTGGSTVVKASFNEAIACPGISPSAFDVVSGKNRLRVISVACRGEAAEVLNLTLSDPVRGGDQVSVSARGRSGVPADRAGNPSSADFGSTQASNVGPLLTMASRAGRPQVVTAAGVEIVGTAVDPDGTLDAIEVSVDGGAWSAAGVDCSRCGRDGESGWTFRPRAGLAHGKHKLEIRSVDNAGSKSGAGSAGVTVDAVAPSMAAARAEGANSAVEVSFSEPVACNGNAAGQFSARIGGRRASVVSGTCAGDAAQLTVSPSPRGGDKVEVSVRGPSRRGQAVTDVAGNPVSAGGTTVTATNRPPVLQVDTDVSEVFANPGLKPGTKVRVEGTASDPDGQIESVEASVDEGPFSARLVRCRGCGRSQEVTFTIDVEQAAPETRRTVAFRARDGASAFSSPEGSSVASDAQTPVFETISARSGVSTVTAGFSEPIDCTTVDKSSFRVTSNGKARKVLTTLCAGDAQEEVQLRVAGRIKPGETMAVQLIGGLTDPAGNPVQPVTLKGLKVPKGH